MARRKRSENPETVTAATAVATVTVEEVPAGVSAPAGAAPPPSGQAPLVASGAPAMPAGRLWKCGTCKAETNIPFAVPPGVEIECPSCHTVTKTDRRSKVAIVGFADSWPLAPYHNSAWEIWTLNQFYDLVGDKVNLAELMVENRLRWFDLHSRYDLENDVNVIARHPHHMQKLRELKCPVYMQQHHDDIPGSIEYPMTEMTRIFGGYWTNSVSYMIALAIAEGFKEMGLYGVNMAQDSEYVGQRPSCEYFCGWARGAGITVHIPPQSDLLKAKYLYAYEDDKANAFMAKLDQLASEHQAKMIAHAKQRDENDAYYQQFNGAIQQIQAIKRIASIER